MFVIRWHDPKASDGWVTGWLSRFPNHFRGKTNRTDDTRRYWKTRAGAQRIADKNPMGTGMTYEVEELGLGEGSLPQDDFMKGMIKLPEQSWIQRDIEAARAACAIKIIDPSLGYVANLELAEPGIRQRINDEGFDARVAGDTLDRNPYIRDGEYEWWRNGWFAADDNLAQEG